MQCENREQISVMPGRGDEALLRADVPGIHVLLSGGLKDVDGRDRPGQDELPASSLRNESKPRKGGLANSVIRHLVSFTVTLSHRSGSLIRATPEPGTSFRGARQREPQMRYYA